MPPLSDIPTLLRNRPLARPAGGRSDTGTATLPTTGPPSSTGFLRVRGVAIGLWGVFSGVSALAHFPGGAFDVVRATKRAGNGPFGTFPVPIGGA